MRGSARQEDGIGGAAPDAGVSRNPLGRIEKLRCQGLGDNYFFLIRPYLFSIVCLVLTKGVGSKKLKLNSFFRMRVFFGKKTLQTGTEFFCAGESPARVSCAGASGEGGAFGSEQRRILLAFADQRPLRAKHWACAASGLAQLQDDRRGATMPPARQVPGLTSRRIQP
ncbi:hypothetical protein ACMHYJ_04030 [Castellaniella hirudinis]|uniref:hypothetical protein n=1 Tax=Castellaniella hirudinis TaxID=1144617 RepID=UPI0039C3BCDD